jgi:hypothetical protein
LLKHVQRQGLVDGLSLGPVKSIEKLDQDQSTLPLKEGDELTCCEDSLLQLGLDRGTWNKTVPPDSSTNRQAAAAAAAAAITLSMQLGTSVTTRFGTIQLL